VDSRFQIKGRQHDAPLIDFNLRSSIYNLKCHPSLPRLAALL
jgi:hypothetical protein